jgi:tRNA dimethylallyltransferase
VRALHDKFQVSYDQLEFYGLEYREIALYLQGKATFEEMRSNLLNRIRQFAKRQDIFFRKLERDGVDIYWLERGSEEAAAALLTAFLAGKELPGPGFRLADHKNPPSYKK